MLIAVERYSIDIDYSTFSFSKKGITVLWTFFKDKFSANSSIKKKQTNEYNRTEKKTDKYGNQANGYQWGEGETESGVEQDRHGG